VSVEKSAGILVAVAAASVAAALAAPSEAARASTAGAKDVRYVEIAEGHRFSGCVARAGFVVSRRADLSRHASCLHPEVARKARSVDFRRYAVVLASWEAPQSSYRLEVVALRRAGGRLRATVFLHPPTGGSLPATTVNYVVVRIARSATAGLRDARVVVRRVL
jgi:hypothetical protein